MVLPDSGVMANWVEDHPDGGAVEVKFALQTGKTGPIETLPERVPWAPLEGPWL